MAISDLQHDLDDPEIPVSDIAERAGSMLQAMDGSVPEFYDLTQETRQELRVLAELLNGIADRSRVLEAATGGRLNHITRPRSIGEVVGKLRAIVGAAAH